jgi:hypothetical protein
MFTLSAVVADWSCAKVTSQGVGDGGVPSR